MKDLFRNKHYRGRNYECTNVIVCERLSDDSPMPDRNNWVSDPNYPIEKLTSLYIENDIRYYGYL